MLGKILDKTKFPMVYSVEGELKKYRDTNIYYYVCDRFFDTNSYIGINYKHQLV